ncbi:hypothetical protein [Flavobacterium piscis]|uniref:Uncharacterized protein n=1 Tax=Flavobacterium piscis TaxID=1114874 RepID=A0ABU1YD33_9FLAO|nr:hypothetical protein [Flavobacterium piscis]MDR7212068.1 hypothetical protein [Flavobacterium piscis]
MGEYAPIVVGEIEGLKTGLVTDLDLWYLTRDFEYEKLEGEWLVGFGVGFTKGQRLRNQIRENASLEIFSERIHAVLGFLEVNCYSIFISSIDSYIEHIDNWNYKNLTLTVVKEVQTLLESNKIQQALQTLVDYYEKNFMLIDLVKFEKIIGRLKELRKQKQHKRITTIQYNDIKQQIATDLKQWIDILVTNK